jgi:hypothetical protein
MSRNTAGKKLKNRVRHVVELAPKVKPGSVAQGKPNGKPCDLIKVTLKNASQHGAQIGLMVKEYIGAHELLYRSLARYSFRDVNGKLDSALFDYTWTFVRSAAMDGRYVTNGNLRTTKTRIKEKLGFPKQSNKANNKPKPIKDTDMIDIFDGWVKRKQSVPGIVTVTIAYAIKNGMDKTQIRAIVNQIK